MYHKNAQQFCSIYNYGTDKKNLVHPVLKRVCTEPTKKKEVLQCLALARRKKLQIFKFVTLMEKDGPFC